MGWYEMIHIRWIPMSKWPVRWLSLKKVAICVRVCSTLNCVKAVASSTFVTVTVFGNTIGKCVACRFVVLVFLVSVSAEVTCTLRCSKTAALYSYLCCWTITTHSNVLARTLTSAHTSGNLWQNDNDEGTDDNDRDGISHIFGYLEHFSVVG